MPVGKPYVTIVEVPDLIYADRAAAAKMGFEVWLERCQTLGYEPILERDGDEETINMKMNMITTDGIHRLHVSGPVRDVIVLDVDGDG